MKERGYSIRGAGRETLRYKDANVECEMAHYSDNWGTTHSVVLYNVGSIKGRPWHLNHEQMRLIEDRVKEYLGTRRFFGIPYGKATVSVIRNERAI